MAAVSASMLLVAGVGWIGYRDLSAGITTSEALAGAPTSPGGDQNILIMGLDSRRDQRGQLLAPDLYDVLHAGDENSGENDADALIVLHVPGGSDKITAISIPRDDYVDLQGCPGSQCRGKVKHAYSLAYQRALKRGSADDAHPGASAVAHTAAQEQMAREAGRKAEISTVRQLLGVPIDHFIEVSLAAFVQIARAVQPITVCLADATADPYYSGANFHKGVQQIDAAQAMAFVRQRRDVNNEAFTDLDRTRRQQAFIASLAGALRGGGTLSSPGALQQLIEVARQNVAVDAGFDVAGFLQNAATLGDRPLTLYTLPISEFSRTADGEDVNVIDVPTIRSIVHGLVWTASPSTTAIAGSGAPAPPPSAVLNVINAARRDGLAASLEQTLANGPLEKGTSSTAESAAQTSDIAYGPGAQAAATTLAERLGLDATPSDQIAPGTVQLTVGTDFAARSSVDDRDSASQGSSAAATTPVTAVPATSAAGDAPPPTDLTRMNGQDTPCVR